MNSGRGDLEIIEERVMLAIPRGDREELRVSFTRARMHDGRETAWHGLRVWFRGEDGSMRPGKAGVTIRGREIVAVARELTKAASGGPERSAPENSNKTDDIPF